MNKFSVFFSVLFVLVVFPAWAGGNIRPDASLGPRALGMCGAHNAVSGDGAAFYHNVANISQTPRFLELDLDTVVTKARFREPSGENHISNTGLFPMPLLALVDPLDDKWTIGLALYPNDGLGVEYEGLKYEKSLLASINFTMAAAWQVNDKLSVGFGLDIVYGQLEENAIFDQLGFPVDGVFLRSKANGWGIGYRLGLRYDLCDWLSLGASFASRRQVDMDCRSDVSVCGLSLGMLRGQTSIGFPGRLGLGLAIKPINDWLIAVDFDWYDYSELDKIEFDFDWLKVTQEMWKSNKSFHLGVERSIDEQWKLRFGVAALWPAGSEEKTVPIIPDGMGYCASIGAGWTNQSGDLTIDFAFVYGWMERNVSPGIGVLCPGHERVDVGIFSAGIRYKF